MSMGSGSLETEGTTWYGIWRPTTASSHGESIERLNSCSQNTVIVPNGAHYIFQDHR
jgi:hypothetical protein